MIVFTPDETVHPSCEPKPSPIEQLARGWSATVRHDDPKSEALTADDISKIERQPPALRASAVYYARRGWPVFPLAKHSKKPAIPKDKGGNGVLDANTDIDRIQRWWHTHPQHNIGLATGYLFDVIDVDVKNSGVKSFMNVLEHIPNVHGVAVTASGGLHLYVPPTGRGNYASLRPGIDYRGKSGYVVAPPSTLGPHGRDYSWLTVPSPFIKRQTS